MKAPLAVRAVPNYPSIHFGTQRYFCILNVSILGSSKTQRGLFIRVQKPGKANLSSSFTSAVLM